MNQRQIDKIFRLANSFEEGPETMTNSLRNMTIFEEQVLRACHHDFDCLTQEEAAVKLNVSPSKISRTLNELEERAKTCKPIAVMFPILTEQQFKVYDCIVGRGLSTADTAEALGYATVVTVNKMLTTIRDKGMKIPKRCNLPKSKSYAPSMDKEVTHKF
jgi:predicted DNA-binding protein (UPF0251 family)